MFNFGGLFSGDNGRRIEIDSNMNAIDEPFDGDVDDTVTTGEDDTVGFEGASEWQVVQ